MRRVAGLSAGTFPVRRKWAGIVILICLSSTSGLARAGAAADDLLKLSPEQVISRVMTVYSRIYSAQGRITRTFETGDVKTSFSGRFAVKRPDRLLVELVGEVHQYTAYDGKEFRVYFTKENRGVYVKAEEMTPLERFVLGPEPFFGNILQVMKSGFTFAVADVVEGNLILKATPQKPVQFKFILIAIDPSSWTVRAVEYFDMENTLVNQVRYLKFQSVGDSLFFPTTTTTSSVVNEDIVVETSDLTRVELNIPLGEESFLIPSNDDTTWISKSALKEYTR